MSSHTLSLLPTVLFVLLVLEFTSGGLSTSCQHQSLAHSVHLNPHQSHSHQRTSPEELEQRTTHGTPGRRATRRNWNRLQNHSRVQVYAEPDQFVLNHPRLTSTGYQKAAMRSATANPPALQADYGRGKAEMHSAAATQATLHADYGRGKAEMRSAAASQAALQADHEHQKLRMHSAAATPAARLQLPQHCRPIMGIGRLRCIPRLRVQQHSMPNEHRKAATHSAAASPAALQADYEYWKAEMHSAAASPAELHADHGHLTVATCSILH